jgi:Fe-S-cluster containining protein
MMMPKRRLSKVIAAQEVVDRFRQLFSCLRCGECCNVFGGVRIAKDEIGRLPVPQNEQLDVFELPDGTCYMKEPCRFYDASRTACSIYNERPATCRNFPLYNERLEDGKIHLGVVEMCPAALKALDELEAE